MARKTNKTAHVLNLLSGSGAQKNTKPEPEQEEKETASEKPTPAVASVTMDTKDTEDAVSDLIHQQLMSAFMEEDALKPAEEPETEAEPTSEAEPEPTLEAELSAPELAPAPELKQEPEAQAEKAPDDEPEEEQEPEFVVLNVIEQIVRDKIIYFMRQFDVCTCDRCIADTTALTLNGLKPKYLVTPPSAVSPLISFYTSRYLSDITVEATKACMTVKENPRHQKEGGAESSY